MINYWTVRRWVVDSARGVKYFAQRLFRGYSDPETWNVGHSTAGYALPRLKAMRKDLHGWPCGLGEDNDKEGLEIWEGYIDDMIYGLSVLAEEKEMDRETDQERALRGQKLFGEYLATLWD